MKKIACLTTFGDWDEAYSPCNVVRHQLTSLLYYGYEPVLFVLDCFPEDFDIPGVEIRRVLPTLKFEPYHGIIQHRNVPNEFEKDLAKVVPAYEQHFKDIDVMLCHDIIFQDSFLPYNAALHKIVPPNPEIKFYHWMHSGPSARPKDISYPIDCLFSVPPRSRIIYMNGYDTTRVAEMYGVYQDSVYVVHNPIDYRLQKGIHELTEKIITDYRLGEADVIAVYPLSTTRMGSGGKQLHKAIKVMAKLKENGVNIRYIICNAHANAETEKKAIGDMRTLAQSYGIDPRHELIFTSLIESPKYENGVPHEVVIQLINYADIFLFPSVSENCPLVLLEAALGKNLLVLNEDFSPMKDFVGPHALYFKFDSVTTVTNHPIGEDNYYNDVAKIIKSELEHNRIYRSHLEIRQKFNLDYIFRNELEPLFFADWESKDLTAEVPKALPPQEPIENNELPRK